MTVLVSKPAVNLREELASLRNQGGYQEQQFYFDGLVTNGTFDSDVTSWSVGGGGSAASVSGEAEITYSGSVTTLEQTVTVVAGSTYEITATARKGTATTCQLYYRDSGDVQFGAETSGNNTTYTAVVAASTTSLKVWGRVPNAGTGYIDNVSVFETDGTNVVHRMPKGWKPKDVYEDGLLQREGSAHDYEVVYDGFDYFVKPTVAPSATTQTCVIGVKA